MAACRFGSRITCSASTAALRRSACAIHSVTQSGAPSWNASRSSCLGSDQSIYLQVTRGAHPVRNHVIPAEITPNVLAFTSENPPRDQEKAQRGISVITLEDIRWHRCDIKATTLLANVLARAQATEEGADEAILIRDGAAMEGTASNLFVVSNGLLITPPDSDELLPGITRDLVLELAQEAGVPYAQAAIGAADLEDRRRDLADQLDPRDRGGREAQWPPGRRRRAGRTLAPHGRAVPGLQGTPAPGERMP